MHFSQYCEDPSGIDTRVTDFNQSWGMDCLPAARTNLSSIWANRVAHRTDDNSYTSLYLYLKWGLATDPQTTTPNTTKYISVNSSDYRDYSSSNSDTLCASFQNIFSYRELTRALEECQPQFKTLAVWMRVMRHPLGYIFCTNSVESINFPENFRYIQLVKKFVPSNEFNYHRNSLFDPPLNLSQCLTK
jgi:hypothetical protein